MPPGDVPQIPAVNPPGQVPGEVEKARESVPKPNSEIPVTSTRSGRRVIPPKRLGFNYEKNSLDTSSPFSLNRTLIRKSS